MLAVLFWIVFSLLVLLLVIPDRWHARREVAKHQGLVSALRRSQMETAMKRGWGKK
jgi:hypothetical protein